MKQKLLKPLRLRVLMLVALLCAGFTSAWGDEVYYILEPVSTGQNAPHNAYASPTTTTISGIEWSVTGNSEMVPWRIGGKSITGTDRTVESKTAMGSAISKVELTVGAASSITVNSLKLIVASDKDFDNQIDVVSSNFIANSTITFIPTSGTEWANAYYKFVFNVTVSGDKNKFVEFTKAEFYSAVADNRTGVNMTGFTALSTTLVRGEETTTSVTNDQSGWEPSYTYSSSKESVATVDENGIITAVGKGTATITAALNIAASDENYKLGETTRKSIDITVNNPTHTATFSINGDVSTADIEEGEAIAFPTDITEIFGKQFVGWTTATIDGSTNERPATLITAATMGSDEVTYYAVFANKEGEEKIATLTANERFGTQYKPKEFTDDLGNTWSGVCNSSDPNSTGTIVYGLNSDASHYLVSPTFGNNITSVKVIAYNGSSTKNRYFYLKDDGKEVGSIFVAKSTQGKELIAELNGNEFRQFTMTASDALQFSSIIVSFGSTTYSDYCTTVLPPVAQVGTQKYETLQEAIDAAQGEGVVTLLADAGDYELTDGQVLKLNLNGYTINVTAPVDCVMETEVNENVTTYSAFRGILITNLEELKAFRDQVNSQISYAGQTVKLAADIDMSSVENWEPIGNVTDYPSKAFKGTFDGGKHTISNLTIDEQTVNWGCAGLFGSVSNGTIANLNISNVDIKSHHYSSAIVAYKGDGTNVTIENCHVIGGTITSTPELINGSYDNGDKVGGILGYGANPTTIKDCSVEGLTITGYRDLGSIGGFIAGTVTNCTAKDIVINQNNKNGYKTDDMLSTCGQLVGGRSTNAATVNADTEKYENVVINQTGFVAQIGEKKYNSLQAAFDAGTDGETVTLLTDVDATDAMYGIDSRFNLWVKTGVTVEGDGHTITVKGRGIGVQGASDNIDVTFKNVTVKNVGNANGRCIDTRGNLASLTLEGVTLTTAESSYTGYLQPLTIGGNQSSTTIVNITNSNIIVVDDAKKGYAITAFNPVNMTVDGSTIKGWACFNLKAADSSAGSNGSNITVTNSTLVSANGTPGDTNAFSLIKIEDDNVNVDITGSTINVNGGGNTQSIVSFLKLDLTSSSQNCTVSMGDGNNVTLEGDYRYASNEGETSHLYISGGTFNQPVPEENCAEGKIPADLGDGKYSVKDGQYVAQVGDAKFETLNEAIDALTEENNTITLLANITDTYTLAEAQSLNVNLNGYTINVAAPTGYILQTSEADGVTTYSYVAPVAKIGDNLYASLAEAVAAVPDGTETTITMLADETFTGNAGVTIATTKNVKLDLNGKLVKLVVTESKTSQLILNNGILTIVDNSEEQTGELTHELAEGALAGDWNATPQRNYVTNVITNCGTLNMESGTLRAGNMTGSIIYAVDNNSTSYDATFNMKGGMVTGIGTLVRQFCNSKTKENIINVSGGKIESSGYTAMWTQVLSKDNKATLNITGGEVKGNEYAWYDTGSKEATAVNYSISGGNLTGKIYSYAKAYGVIGGFVSGGLFSENVSSYCADGFTIVGNTDEATKDEYPYAVGEAEIIYSWIQDGTEIKKYHLFATPFVKDYLMDGEFITLLKDITLTEDIACQLAEGSFTFRLGEFNVTTGDYSISLLPNVTVLTDKQTDIFSAAEAGYKIVESGSEEEGYSYTAEKVLIAAPTIFHDEGTYEGAIDVAIAGEGTIMYKLGDGEAQTYTTPIAINATTTVTAWTEKDGFKSSEVSKTFTIEAKAASAEVAEGYYTIKNNGNNKYVNVAGRKTVTLVSDTKSAGTVIRVKADEDGVKVLRSQAVDLPRYAERAMSYVPEIVKEVVKKLAANVDDPIIGEQGAELILDKFNQEFDYHLYLEGENNTYRIYGRTPSMKPVVDFYAENKELVDSRLPKVEDFVKEVLQKIVDKVGHGQSVVDMFKVKTVWENMGGTLTDPDVNQAKFFEEVLSSEANVWNFAYQTGMLYWDKVKSYLEENTSELGDYGKYIEKIPQIRPNFKYYIVPSETGLDIISEGNEAILTNAASAAWTLTKRESFDVTFDATLSKNNGKEMYKTLYVDFAYELPENVKALKVESVSDAGVAVTKEITGVVPAQTPVLLMSTDVENLTKTLALSTADGAAVTNELKGNDWLINKFEINTPELETIFALLTKLSSSLGEKYEYLKRKNSGTVNNKYFFGLSVPTPTEEGDFKEAFMNGKIKVLTNGEKGLGFYSNFDKDLVGNEVFMFSEDANPILLTLKGDVDRDGDVDEDDLKALLEIVLGKVTVENNQKNYDFDAAHVNDDEDINIADVTALVNILNE